MTPAYRASYLTAEKFVSAHELKSIRRLLAALHAWHFGGYDGFKNRFESLPDSIMIPYAKAVRTTLPAQIALYRGISKNSDRDCLVAGFRSKLPEEIEMNAWIRAKPALRHNPSAHESWTSDIDIAMQFAESDGCCIAADVSRNDVVHTQAMYDAILDVVRDKGLRVDVDPQFTAAQSEYVLRPRARMITDLMFMQDGDSVADDDDEPKLFRFMRR